MKSVIIAILLVGLLGQVVGILLLPRAWRWRALLALAALDLAWLLWVAESDLSSGSSGAWSIPAIATWMVAHMILLPGVGVEALARLTRWRRPVRLVGLVGVVGVYGWFLGEAYGPVQVTEVRLSFPDLPPAFDGYKIVLVADLHAGPFAGPATLERWASAVEGLQGDLLVGAGDFISYWPAEAELAGRAFAGVRPKDGKIGVLGNHDRFRTDEEVARRLRLHGWVMLLDEGHVVERQGQRLVLLGTRHPYGDPNEFKAYWKGKPWPQGFRIGICHGPEQWPHHLKEKARLTLAAHTHGGQVDLRPFFNAALRRSPYLHGLYEQGADRMFVSRGLGCTGFPFRFRCRPEAVRITLARG